MENIVDTVAAAASERDDVAVWGDVLRAYAAALDEQRALLLSTQPEGVLEGHELLPLPFVPPVSLPPCPSELWGVLASLQAETEGLTTFAADLLERCQPPAAASRSSVTAASTSNDRRSFMDARL